jgi:mono/diheme cytochrome c family protein
MRAFVVALVLAGCSSGPFSAPLVLGGRSYDTATLNHGFRVYQQNCRACHGDRGDGHGLSAAGMWPPPRDFSQGIFKFARVPAPDLPPDSELARILRDGLNGTGMLAWRLSDADLDAVIAYVKTFSPRSTRAGNAPRSDAAKRSITARRCARAATPRTSVARVSTRSRARSARRFPRTRRRCTRAA